MRPSAVEVWDFHDMQHVVSGASAGCGLDIAFRLGSPNGSRSSECVPAEVLEHGESSDLREIGPRCRSKEGVH